MIKPLTITFVLTILQGCASTNNIYTFPENVDVSKLTVNRQMEPHSAITTLIHKHQEFSQCGKGAPKQESQLVFKLDEGNPLISNINDNGAYVESEKELVLSVVSYSQNYIFIGGNIPCAYGLEFTPKSGQDYELKLAGELSPQPPNNCTVELWSTNKTSGKKKKESFEKLHECQF